MGAASSTSPFWRDVLGCTQYASRPWKASPLTSPPPCLSPCRVRISAPPLRARTIASSTKRWMPSFPRGHRGGSTLFSASMLNQSHISRSEKEWGYASHIDFEKAECSEPQHPLLLHGDCRGCPPHPRARRLGGIHRFERRILSRPPPPFHKEIHVLQMERPPFSLLRAPLRPFTSSEGLHSTHQIHQGAFPVSASGSGWPAAILLLS
jgi:hypothetical protein